MKREHALLEQKRQLEAIGLLTHCWEKFRGKCQCKSSLETQLSRNLKVAGSLQPSGLKHPFESPLLHFPNFGVQGTSAKTTLLETTLLRSFERSAEARELET